MTAIASDVAGARVAGYRPFLDGLRAVAVYLVVVFHSGSEPFTGGYVGVDVFFVLSGFLVTQLLMRDLEGGGSISLGRFYSRRFRRLLPAAFVVLVVTALVYSALASPIEVAQSVNGFRASFLYYANWEFIAQSSDYFGADINANPVLQFWSLAVEEQFYLLWPLLLGGLFAISVRFRSRQWLMIRVVVLGGAVASLLWALSLRTANPNRAYYGTDARAYQLLAGALLALTPGLITSLDGFTRTARVVAATSVAALIVVASSWVQLNAIERGVAATIIAIALLITLEISQGGLAQRTLSLAPVVYLGKISYGTYLWHWPVVLVMARTSNLSPLSTVALTVLIATGLASLSYQILEYPVRLSTLLDRYRIPVIAAGLAISAVSGLFVVPRMLETAVSSSEGPVVAEVSGGGTPIPDGVEGAFFDRFDFNRCSPGRGVSCVLVEGQGPKVLIVGDSHAGMLTPMFSGIAERHGAELSVGFLSYCPWTSGIRYAGIGGTCFAEQKTMFGETIPELDPDIVVLVHRSYDDPANRLDLADVDAGRLASGSDEATAAIRERITDVVDGLRADGRLVVMIEPVPVAPRDQNPLTCLSGADFVESCRFVTQTEPTPEEQIMRQVAKEDAGVWSLDLDSLVCPYQPICDPVVLGMVVRSDDNHLTTKFATAVLSDAVDEFLIKNGVLAAT